jgi:hypothetical protein
VELKIADVEKYIMETIVIQLYVLHYYAVHFNSLRMSGFLWRSSLSGHKNLVLQLAVFGHLFCS